MDALKDKNGIIQLPVVARQKHTLAGKLEISRVLNYHAGTGSGAQSYLHMRNQGADASCLSIAAIVAALAEC